MAWDTQRTRDLLLEAATAEFAARGLSGGRVDRIARDAGVNKERIYQYFSNKDGLFAAVLERALLRIVDAVPLVVETPEDVVGYALAVFDYHAADPTLARLLFWEGLELGEPVALALRRDQMDAKAEQLARALPGASAADLGELLVTIVTLAASWPVLRHLDATVGTGHRGSRRAAVAEAVRSTVAGWSGAPGGDRPA